MSEYIISEIKRDHIMNLLKEGKREDGRGVDDIREVQISVGCIESADGSARVKVGKTEVIAGVKIIPGTPFGDTPDSGVLTMGAELIPMAHPMFESGPPGEDAIELARVVDRGIRESGMVDVKALCITAGEEVWMCFVDIYALDYDGNLFDAANLATVSALRTAVIPGEQYGKGENRPLPVTCTPVSITSVKIGNDLILDPNFDEEMISSARLTVTTDDDGNFRAMQKGGKGSITRKELSLCLDRAVEKGKVLRKIIG
ncbi:exosome complex component Rrp42 [Candidatus Methanoplasma termitum]|uniref:Exosome complex component Rrp42 n=2 Tax=Candidatus Methanoplasma termitum TaxID=1577791 RepID=A0A0A7LD51_9ARCH|nr:exosome complex protein Rrp42 [Candidatus Methanoplasma termitum]AIZ56933.1 exosome complex component Rrp42 [Candidatus Methanoplasma termitum]MCL2333539.1 exosome complex protein Rrp42 [Candidatus Methanoplasma sp.]